MATYWLKHYGFVGDEPYLAHHGIQGQKWGVKNGPPYPLSRSKSDNQKIPDIKKIHKTARQAANSISSKVIKDSKEPVGNQNCMLCAWAAEQWFRGNKVLPRPVYSPRDPIFKLNPKMIVKNKTVKSIGGLKDTVDYCKSMPDGSRFYCHVNWKGSSGGHEFLVVNASGNVMVLDTQAGIYDSINSNDGKSYFESINANNSYIFRIDNRELNRDFLKYNDRNYLVNWDESVDIPYMKKHNML